MGARRTGGAGGGCAGDGAQENGRTGAWGHTGTGAGGRTGLRADRLTLVADEEAHAGAAAVGGEEQAQGVPGAEQELRRLRAVVLADQRGGAGRPVPHLQGVVVDFRLEPARVGVGQKGSKRAAVLTFRHPCKGCIHW